MRFSLKFISFDKIPIVIWIFFWEFHNCILTILTHFLEVISLEVSSSEIPPSKDGPYCKDKQAPDS